MSTPNDPQKTSEADIVPPDELESPAENAAKVPEATENPSAIKILPTLKFYQKTYAVGSANNDSKAVKLFKEYENRDKLQRLKQELFAVSKDRATDELCARTVGPNRKGVYKTYGKWALMMLNLLNSKN